MNLVSLNNAISAIGIRPYDVLFVSATGAGKSSTINSYFLQELATIGRGADPQTMQCVRATTSMKICAFTTALDLVIVRKMTALTQKKSLNF